MSYLRVIPRDLFNEANLLKCYGQLALQLEFHNIQGVAMEHHCEHDKFDVYQNQDDGSLSIGNVSLTVRGEACVLFRPLNSHQPWPLYCVVGDNDISVFKDDGTFTPEFLAFLKGNFDAFLKGADDEGNR